jgi:hypothetical protein
MFLGVSLAIITNPLRNPVRVHPPITQHQILVPVHQDCVKLCRMWRDKWIPADLVERIVALRKRLFVVHPCPAAVAAHVIRQYERRAVFPWCGVVESVAWLEIKPDGNTNMRIAAEWKYRDGRAITT